MYDKEVSQSAVMEEVLGRPFHRGVMALGGRAHFPHHMTSWLTHKAGMVDAQLGVKKPGGNKETHKAN